MEIEWGRKRLVTDFAHGMGGRNYEQLVSLFTPEGVFDRVGSVLAGRLASSSVPPADAPH
jgi:hypothetical protein